MIEMRIGLFMETGETIFQMEEIKTSSLISINSILQLDYSFSILSILYTCELFVLLFTYRRRRLHSQVSLYWIRSNKRSLRLNRRLGTHLLCAAMSHLSDDTHPRCFLKIEQACKYSYSCLMLPWKRSHSSDYKKRTVMYCSGFTK